MMVYVKDLNTGQWVAEQIYETRPLPEHIQRIIRERSGE